eukprot:6028331-Pyramimonas_sp.AAC.1
MVVLSSLKRFTMADDRREPRLHVALRDAPGTGLDFNLLGQRNPLSRNLFSILFSVAGSGGGSG